MDYLAQRFKYSSHHRTTQPPLLMDGSGLSAFSSLLLIVSFSPLGLLPVFSSSGLPLSFSSPGLLSAFSLSDLPSLFPSSDFPPDLFSSALLALASIALVCLVSAFMNAGGAGSRISAAGLAKPVSPRPRFSTLSAFAQIGRAH